MLREPRLADAGFSRDEEHTAPTANRILQGGRQLSRFSVPANEGPPSLQPGWLPDLAHRNVSVDHDRPYRARTFNRVAETVGISVSGASRVVDHLVGHGLVSRTEDARDRRAKRVSISPTGRELLRTFERDVTEAQFNVIAELPADDQAVIIRAIDLIAGAAAARAPAALGQPHLPATPSPRAEQRHAVEDPVRGEEREQQ